MMRIRYLIFPLLLLFAAILFLGSFPASATSGPQPLPEPSPPVGQIIFYGPDAADVLSQGHDFAQKCDCYVYEGQLSTTINELVQLTLNYTVGG